METWAVFIIVRSYESFFWPNNAPCTETLFFPTQELAERAKEILEEQDGVLSVSVIQTEDGK